MSEEQAKELETHEGESTPDDGKAKWTPEQQAEFNKRAADLKKSAAADERKKILAEFEAKQTTEKEAAEKKRLESEGKYVEASQLAEKSKSEADERARTAEQKAETLELQMSFERVVFKKGIEFASDEAAADAFSKLDRETVKADGIEKAFEKLQKEHFYYFNEAQQSVQPNTDAGQRGRRQTNQKSEDDRKAEIVQRFNIRRPR